MQFAKLKQAKSSWKEYILYINTSNSGVMLSFKWETKSTTEDLDLNNRVNYLAQIRNLQKAYKYTENVNSLARKEITLANLNLLFEFFYLKSLINLL